MPDMCYFCGSINENQAYHKILANNSMKKDIHPASYRTVIFKDISTDESFLGKSCANSKEMVTWEDGKEYPLIKMEISAYSHPFFTGKMKFVDTAGRIDKFNKKFANFAKVEKVSE
jgi:large subunit ribosomal protein L31